MENTDLVDCYKSAESHFKEGHYEETKVKLSSMINKYISLGDTGQTTEKDHIRKELAKLFNLRGQVNYKFVDFTAALEDYSQAIEFNGSFAAAYYNRATILYRMGEFSISVRDMELACQLDPLNVEFAEGLTECQRASTSEINV